MIENEYGLYGEIVEKLLFILVFGFLFGFGFGCSLLVMRDILHLLNYNR